MAAPHLEYVTREECAANHRENGSFTLLKTAIIGLAVTAALAAVAWSMTTATEQGRLDERVVANQEKIREMREEIRNLPALLVQTIRAEFKRQEKEN